MSDNTRRLNPAEELVSMFIGLVVLVAISTLIVGYVRRHKGNIDVPGIATTSVEKSEETPAEEKLSRVYEVQKGDSLWKIAQLQYQDGYKYVELIKANSLKSPGSLVIGQKLIIPDLGGEQVSKETLVKAVGGEVVVKSGDSLWKIALSTYGDGFAWTKIWSENKQIIIDPNQIEVGMKLILPKG